MYSKSFSAGLLHAEQLGIRAPSLHKHIADKHEVDVTLIAVGFSEQATTFAAANSESSAQ